MNTTAESFLEAEPRQFEDEAKPIFLAWEWLRIPFNIILGAESFLILGDLILDAHVLIPGVFVGVAANLCFLLGPTTETFVAWLGFRSRSLRYVLFVLGMLFSIAVTYVVAGEAFRYHQYAL